MIFELPDSFSTHESLESYKEAVNSVQFSDFAKLTEEIRAILNHAATLYQIFALVNMNLNSIPFVKDGTGLGR